MDSKLDHEAGASQCSSNGASILEIFDFDQIRDIDRWKSHKTYFGVTTLNIMTFSITTLSIMTFSVMTLSIMTLSIMTLSIMVFSIIAFSTSVNKI